MTMARTSICSPIIRCVISAVTGPSAIRATETSGGCPSWSGTSSAGCSSASSSAPPGRGVNAAVKLRWEGVDSMRRPSTRERTRRVGKLWSLEREDSSADANLTTPRSVLITWLFSPCRNNRCLFFVLGLSLLAIIFYGRNIGGLWWRWRRG